MRRLSIRSATRSFARDTRANIAVIIAIVAPLLIAGAGFVADYAGASTARAQLQAAIDAAVLAGVKAASTATQSESIALAGEVFAVNSGLDEATVTTKFVFNEDKSLTGTAQYDYPALFSNFLPVSAFDIGVVATAKAGASSSSVCILLLDPDANQSLLTNSNAKINATGCEIHVASNANPGAIFNSGVKIDAEKVCLKSTHYINNGGSIANLETGCETVKNPYVGALPAPSSTTCSGSYANGGNFTGTLTLNPGVYCGWFNFNGTTNVTLKPGVYVVKNGGWNVNGGTWKGNGVTFYFADTSKIQFNSGMNMTLSAPTSGNWKGILFYERDGLSESQLVFNDSVYESLSGLIYLPSRNLTFNSTSTITSPKMSVIANTAIFNTVNWKLAPSDDWPISASGGGDGNPVLTQ